MGNVTVTWTLHVLDEHRQPSIWSDRRCWRSRGWEMERRDGFNSVWTVVFSTKSLESGVGEDLDGTRALKRTQKTWTLSVLCSSSTRWWLCCCQCLDSQWLICECLQKFNSLTWLISTRIVSLYFPKFFLPSHNCSTSWKPQRIFLSWIHRGVLLLSSQRVLPIAWNVHYESVLLSLSSTRNLESLTWRHLLDSYRISPLFLKSWSKWYLHVFQKMVFQKMNQNPHDILEMILNLNHSYDFFFGFVLSSVFGSSFLF